MKNVALKISKHYQIILSTLLIAGVLTCVACNEYTKYQNQKRLTGIEKTR